MFRGKQGKLAIRTCLGLMAGILSMLVILSGLSGSFRNSLFDDSRSTVLLDRDGVLLGARIARDGQWRFPQGEYIPEKYKVALLEYEDRYFYLHPGINPWAFWRAVRINLSAGRIVSGGSTITMQVMRLSGGQSKRNYATKFQEVILALALEAVSTKQEILELYAGHAPYGGNVVGIEAAAWRYFGRSPMDLTWSEAALLAVLPNSPALIHPSRNRDLLKNKRDRLLERLHEQGYFSSMELNLAQREPIPPAPRPLPALSPHLLDRMAISHEGKVIRSTLDSRIQEQVIQILHAHHRILELNQIQNAAALVAEVTTGNVIAYVGNTSPGGETLHENYVDVIIAPRSSGSILKPFLYAAMLDDGLILPNSLVKDIPTWLGGFSPKNFNYQYDGVVPASMALSRSLNVPAVRMLQDFGHDRFCHLLKDLGFTTITRAADDYGLSVILGGAEVTLWDLAGVYAGMARTLRNFYERNGKYNVLEDFRTLNLMDHEPSLLQSAALKGDMSPNPLISAGSVWLTFEALLKVNRPDEEIHWEQFSSSGKIAWKTGTSFGFRDAWAVGVTPDHVIAVWVGNADGEGRAGLSGVSSAAPVMFDLFRLLPSDGWFDPPYDELIRIPVCKLSGYRAGDFCGEADTAWVIASSLQLPSCPYHQIIHLDEAGKYRVHSDCEEVSRIKSMPWFVLSPAADKYYRMKNPAYKPLPPFRPDCLSQSGLVPMEFIYPENGVKIFIPHEFGGGLGKAVFELAHRDARAKVYWHLDDQYLGQTQGLHQIECSPQPGKHKIIVYDQNGFSASSSFEVRGK